MPMKKIIAAGHICIDITPIFAADKPQSIEKLLCPGTLIQMKEADIHTGGSVANTGLALKILGAEVELMGKIGKDAFGDIILDILKKYDAQKGMILCNDSSTSYSIVISPPGTDRIFLHNPGANNTFTYEDLDFEKIKEASHFHFGYPTIMRNMYLNDGKELVRIFRKVKGLGLSTSLDMSSIDPESEAGQCDWKKIIQNVLPYVDFFVPSAEELGFMINREAYDEWLKRADGKDITTIFSLEKDIKPLGEELLSWGAKAVLIKCGVPGMYFKTNEAKVMASIAPQFESWGNIELFQKSYVPDQVRSGTGAGDTSIAAFLKAILDGYGPKRCLELAAATGASCVTAYDSLGGLKSFEELIHKIENGWPKIEFSL